MDCAQEPKRDTDSSDRGLEVIFPLPLFFAFILPHQKGQSCTATMFRGMTGYSDTLNVPHKLFVSVSNMMHPWSDEIWTCWLDCRFHRRLACSVFLTSGIKICFPSAVLCLDQRFDSAFLKSDRRGPACQDRNLRAEARNGLRAASQQHWNHVSQVKAVRPRHNGLAGNELTTRNLKDSNPRVHRDGAKPGQKPEMLDIASAQTRPFPPSMAIVFQRKSWFSYQSHLMNLLKWALEHGNEMH